MPVERRDPLGQPPLRAREGRRAGASRCRARAGRGSSRPRSRAVREMPEATSVRVDGHRDRARSARSREACQLPLADDRIADQDVVDAGVGHDLGLAELRHLHAGRAGLELDARDLRQLVRLRVRPQRDARSPRPSAAIALDVGPHDVEVDDDLRRVRGQHSTQRGGRRLGRCPGAVLPCRRVGLAGARRRWRRSPRAASRRSPAARCRSRTTTCR